MGGGEGGVEALAELGSWRVRLDFHGIHKVVGVVDDDPDLVTSGVEVVFADVTVEGSVAQGVGQAVEERVAVPLDFTGYVLHRGRSDLGICGDGFSKGGVHGGERPGGAFVELEEEEGGGSGEDHGKEGEQGFFAHGLA